MMKNKIKLFLCVLLFCVGCLFVFLEKTEDEGKRAVLNIKRLLSEDEFGIKHVKNWKKEHFSFTTKKGERIYFMPAKDIEYSALSPFYKKRDNGCVQQDDLIYAIDNLTREDLFSLRDCDDETYDQMKQGARRVISKKINLDAYGVIQNNKIHVPIDMEEVFIIKNNKDQIIGQVGYQISEKSEGLKYPITSNDIRDYFIDVEKGVYNVWYWVGREARRKGVATKALQFIKWVLQAEIENINMISRKLKTDTNVIKIKMYTVVRDFNDATHVVLERNGLKKDISELTKDEISSGRLGYKGVIRIR